MTQPSMREKAASEKAKNLKDNYCVLDFSYEQARCQTHDAEVEQQCPTGLENSFAKIRATARAEGEASQREKDCKAICLGCRNNMSTPRPLFPGNPGGTWYHFAEGYRHLCSAAAIRSASKDNP